MNLSLRFAALGVFLLSFLGFGCVSLERSYPDKRYFVIQIEDPKSANAKGGPILAVANLHISPRYSDKSFIYRRSETEYESDFYNQFLSPPSTMISVPSRSTTGRSLAGGPSGPRRSRASVGRT